MAKQKSHQYFTLYYIIILYYFNLELQLKDFIH